MSLEVWLGERLAGVRLLHSLSTQLEHDKDDHLVMIKFIMMMMMIKMIMMMMTMIMMIKTRQKPTTLAKVPRNIAKMTRRSRVVPTWILSVELQKTEEKLKRQF